jgi:cbb3-type cytochrome oxidase subunit 3
MLKKNLSIVVIVLLAMLLMAVVIWIYNRRIENIEMNMRQKAFKN